MSSAFTAQPTSPRQNPTTASDSESDGEQAQVLVVQVGELLYGIAVEQVREVVRAQRFTTVPGAPNVMRGIINVRGAVVTVLELSVLLGTARAVTSSSVVLIEHGTRLIGLAVDAVRDVRAQFVSDDGSDTHLSARVAALDAVALCAPHLLSGAEMGR